MCQQADAAIGGGRRNIFAGFQHHFPANQTTTPQCCHVILAPVILTTVIRPPVILAQVILALVILAPVILAPVILAPVILAPVLYLHL